MSIVVDHSSDEDYSSSMSSSSSGENLDKAEEVQGNRFQPIWDFYNSELSESLRLKWKKQMKMWLLLDWVT